MLSKDQFAEMNARLDETERREQALMQTLRDRLSAVDQKLLQDVRNIGIEHEGRRTMILTELQSLAERVGAFPTQHTAQHIQDQEPLAAPRYVPHHGAQTHPATVPTQHIAHTQTQPQPPAAPVAQQRGDWRAAAERIRKDIETKLHVSNAQHTDPWAEDDHAAAQPL